MRLLLHLLLSFFLLTSASAQRIRALSASESGGNGTLVWPSSSLIIGPPVTFSQIFADPIKVNSAKGAADPPIHGNTDINTGVFWGAADTTGFTTGGVARITATNPGVAVTGTLNVSGAVTLTVPLAAAQGGTGSVSYTVGDLIFANGTTTLGKLQSIASGNALLTNGVGAGPSWGKIGLTTHISGTLPVANGGSGVTSLPKFSVYKSTNQSITGGVTTKLTWDTEEWDTGGQFGSNKFTPSVGKHLLTGMVSMDSVLANETKALYLYKNGASYRNLDAGGTIGGNNGHTFVIAEVIDSTNGTDYYELYIYWAVTHNCAGGQAYTHWQGTFQP